MTFTLCKCQEISLSVNIPFLAFFSMFVCKSTSLTLHLSICPSYTTHPGPHIPIKIYSQTTVIPNTWQMTISNYKPFFFYILPICNQDYKILINRGYKPLIDNIYSYIVCVLLALKLYTVNDQILKIRYMEFILCIFFILPCSNQHSY